MGGSNATGNPAASIRVRSPRGHRRPGADRSGPILPPPAKPAFDGARAENQKPPQGKS